MTTTLLQGDCRELLPTLPAASVQCVVTSPPYWELRDYGMPGQLGLEATPDAYVQALVSVFRLVWRVLRDDGTLWLNLGDSYARGFGGGTPGTKSATNAGSFTDRECRPLPPGLKSKDLVGIPWMVAFALRADGWYLRSDIIWSKPNPMPESVTDRPTKAHEYIFLLSKRERYYYDADAIREPYNEASIGRYKYTLDGTAPTSRQPGGDTDRRKREAHTRDPNPAGRNRRTVWTVATQPFSGVHFATFPEKLIEPCILAGSAARACEVCGAPWARQTEQDGYISAGHGGGTEKQANHLGLSQSSSLRGEGLKRNMVTTGFRPTCACPNEGTARSIVLDPFAGSGTTLRVAERLCRDSIGIDLGYTDLQEQRTNGVQKQMVDLL